MKVRTLTLAHAIVGHGEVPQSLLAGFLLHPAPVSVSATIGAADRALGLLFSFFAGGADAFGRSSSHDATFARLTFDVVARFCN